MTKIGINGFGRIGRCFYRAATQKGLDIVAVNDVTDSKTLAHLLKYDSVFGKLQEAVSVTPNGFTVGGKAVTVLAVREPAQIPWSKFNVDIVLESTGLFANRDAAAKHMTGGAKKVLISAPAKNPDITIVPGINLDKYDSAVHHVVSLASCTTNCVTPLVKVVDDTCEIKHAFMTTAHAYTNDQRILDLPHKDLRRARAAAVSIIPTSTGAAIAVTEVLPSLKGKLDGVALRVPVPDGSIVDLVAEVKKSTTVEAVNSAFKSAAAGQMKGVLEYSDEPLVSADIIGNPHSVVFDSLSTMVLDNSMVKVFGWYDNEWGYSNRLVDMVLRMAQSL
ncbi:MAG TPA: type I glyceraldehyde-3-phosphate dehydrogenase [Methylomirabilota bacterium]|nr:type I glyceraldehyde-3-phosphate dehydrogenase [Methylomirabilota bacterium]